MLTDLNIWQTTEYSELRGLAKEYSIPLSEVIQIDLNRTGICLVNNEVRNGFYEIRDVLTRFPIVNIYQVQTVGQARIFDPRGRYLEYFIKSRIILEEIFKSTGMHPRRWGCYGMNIFAIVGWLRTRTGRKSR